MRSRQDFLTSARADAANYGVAAEYGRIGRSAMAGWSGYEFAESLYVG